MNEELRRSLDRAAGEDPQSDLTESAWRGGRDLRRRRHTAQAVGGLAAAAVLAGAFAVGGGVLADPHAYVGPAVPTVDDTVTATAPLEVSPSPSPSPTPTGDPEVTPTREAPATADEPPSATPTTDDATATDTPRADAPEPTPTETSGAPVTGADGVLVLSADAIEGRPLDGPVEDLVAAVTAELGEPEVYLGSVATNCNAEPPYGDLYSWAVLEITVTDDGVRWGLDSWQELPVAVDLPGSVEMGQTAAEVRSREQVVEETTDLGGATVLHLANGVAVSVGPDGVFRVVNPFLGIC